MKINNFEFLKKKELLSTCTLLTTVFGIKNVWTTRSDFFPIVKLKY